ncbi:MAG: AAA family ATPase [Armatimonadetes bacterium]|nr:AAA family ATPase [Armatimonadota bacterium]
MDEPDIEARVAQFQATFDAIRKEMHKVIVGQEEVVERVLTAVVAGGHVLLEGVPGLGKTVLVKTLGQVLDLSFSRIQFTPDLMPADICGTNIVVEDGGLRGFQFQPGPIFAHFVLADEINRATPKTQSALLEAMQERSVTVAGVVRQLSEPFFVMATQNPIEMEGTYPLPEAQVDRFLFKLIVAFPNVPQLVSILSRTTAGTDVTLEKTADGRAILQMRRLSREVLLSDAVAEYVARLISATHPDHPDAPSSVKQFVRYGSSPRGAQSVVVAAKVHALRQGRFNVACEDVRAVAVPALRHRIIRSFEGEAEGVSTDTLVGEIVKDLDRVAAAR